MDPRPYYACFIHHTKAPDVPHALRDVRAAMNQGNGHLTLLSEGAIAFQGRMEPVETGQLWWIAENEKKLVGQVNEIRDAGGRIETIEPHGDGCGRYNVVFSIAKPCAVLLHWADAEDSDEWLDEDDPDIS